MSCGYSSLSEILMKGAQMFSPAPPPCFMPYNSFMPSPSYYSLFAMPDESAHLSMYLPGANSALFKSALNNGGSAYPGISSPTDTPERNEIADNPAENFDKIDESKLKELQDLETKIKSEKDKATLAELRKQYKALEKEIFGYERASETYGTQYNFYTNLDAQELTDIKNKNQEIKEAQEEAADIAKEIAKVNNRIQQATMQGMQSGANATDYLDVEADKKTLKQLQKNYAAACKSISKLIEEQKAFIKKAGSSKDVTDMGATEVKQAKDAETKANAEAIKASGLVADGKITGTFDESKLPDKFKNNDKVKEAAKALAKYKDQSVEDAIKEGLKANNPIYLALMTNGKANKDVLEFLDGLLDGKKVEDILTSNDPSVNVGYSTLKKQITEARQPEVKPANPSSTVASGTPANANGADGASDSANNTADEQNVTHVQLDDHRTVYRITGEDEERILLEFYCNGKLESLKEIYVGDGAAHSLNQDEINRIMLNPEIASLVLTRAMMGIGTNEPIVEALIMHSNLHDLKRVQEYFDEHKSQFKDQTLREWVEGDYFFSDETRLVTRLDEAKK